VRTTGFNLAAMPVVDNDDRLLSVIAVDDLRQPTIPDDRLDDSRRGPRKRQLLSREALGSCVDFRKRGLPLQRNTACVSRPLTSCAGPTAIAAPTGARSPCSSTTGLPPHRNQGDHGPDGLAFRL
jgi:hypothetical protein